MKSFSSIALNNDSSKKEHRRVLKRFFFFFYKTILCLGDNDVRRREEDSDRSHDCEEGEGDETESVQHHGSKLPVVLYGRGVLVVADLVGDDSQFFQNQVQLSIDARRKGASAGRGHGVSVRVVAHAHVVDGARAPADNARWQWG